MSKQKQKEEKTNKINWNGFYSYAQWLHFENKNKEPHKVIEYLNYFLLSPNLYDNNINLLYKGLSLLSYYYFKMGKILGLDWIYHIMKGILEIDNEQNVEIQSKIIFRYAYIISDITNYFHYANDVLKEVENYQITNKQINEEISELKKKLMTKLNEEQSLNEQSIFLKLNQFEEDCWNRYMEAYTLFITTKFDVKKISATSNVQLNQNEQSFKEDISHQNNHIDINCPYDKFDNIGENKNQTNEMQNDFNNSQENGDDIQKLKLNKTKVLILSEKIMLPFIPRYIYWKNKEDFNDVLSNLILNEPYECYKILNTKQEDLLYIVYSFITKKELIFEGNTTIDEFISLEENNRNHILIIALLNQIKKSNSILEMPEELKYFLDFSTTLKKLKTEKYYYKGVSFKNFGNTCFINAGLQCILHCNLLSQYFHSLEDKNIKRLNQITKLYTNLVKFPEETNLNLFIEKFREIHTKYTEGEQHDSPELITDILNELGKGLSRAKYEFHDSKNGKDTWEKLLQKESSIITDLFYGQMKHEYCCQCPKTEQYEEFLLLDLSVPNYFFPCYLLRLNGPKKTIRITYPSKEELTGEYVRNQIKQNYNITIDIVVINYDKTEVQIARDDICLFNYAYPNTFASLVGYEHNVEIILYEKPPTSVHRVYYIVPCGNYSEKRAIFGNINHKFSSIQGYPIQIIETNQNSVNPKDILDSVKDKNFEFYYKKNMRMFDGKTMYDFYDNNSWSNFVHSVKNKNKIFLYTRMKSVPWERSPNQFEEINPTLIQCLNLLYKHKMEKKCTKCKNTKKITTSFTRLPHYLIIYFKKFYINNQKNFEKNNILVDFPEKFTLEDKNKRVHSYKAFAMNLHKGSIFWGHYLAICKEENNWIKFNDIWKTDNVEFQPTKEVLLVFYERQ